MAPFLRADIFVGDVLVFLGCLDWIFGFRGRLFCLVVDSEDSMLLKE